MSKRRPTVACPQRSDDLDRVIATLARHDMEIITIPSIVFGPWQRWNARDRPSQDMDVPPRFGVLGLYLLAASQSDLSLVMSNGKRHLQKHVIYIGRSTHVEQRLEQTHNAVARYGAEFGDSQRKDLWFSVWHSQWNNQDQDKSRTAIAVALIALFERALILAYAEIHGRMPALNKE